MGPAARTTATLSQPAARCYGSFHFEVIDWPEDEEWDGGCRIPEGRNAVVGHFDVTTTFDAGGLLGSEGDSPFSGIVVMRGVPIVNLGGPE